MWIKGGQNANEMMISKKLLKTATNVDPVKAKKRRLRRIT
jgi:hypothetical protein